MSPVKGLIGESVSTQKQRNIWHPTLVTFDTQPPWAGHRGLQLKQTQYRVRKINTFGLLIRLGVYIVSIHSVLYLCSYLLITSDTIIGHMSGWSFYLLDLLLLLEIQRHSAQLRLWKWTVYGCACGLSVFGCEPWKILSGRCEWLSDWRPSDRRDEPMPLANKEQNKVL